MRKQTKRRTQKAILTNHISHGLCEDPESGQKKALAQNKVLIIERDSDQNSDAPPESKGKKPIIEAFVPGSGPKMA